MAKKNEAGKSIFVALYSKHTNKSETYMNIALPLPYSNMTGILKLYNDSHDLIITSKLRENGQEMRDLFTYSVLDNPFTVSRDFYYKRAHGSHTRS